jgi:molecular chaperone GrpE
MSERDTGTRRGEDDAGERPRVKVTDRRRVRPEEAGDPAGAPARPEEVPAPSPPEAGPGGGGPEGEAVRSELEAAQREAAEYREHLQRLAAEFDNYRKRVLREQTRAVEMASEPLMRKLLEVLDEFELALMAAERRPDFDQFLHGVELVYAKLLDILRSEGLERIEALGQPFDPSRHEALLQSGEGEGEPYVADVLRQGYTLKGRVLRPAGVKVARGPARPPEQG